MDRDLFFGCTSIGFPSLSVCTPDPDEDGPVSKSGLMLYVLHFITFHSLYDEKIGKLVAWWTINGHVGVF